MEEITRKEFKKGGVYQLIYRELQKIHTVPEYTIRVLRENEGIKGFTESSRSYVIMNLDDEDFFMHYDIDSFFIQKDVIATRISSLGLYESFMEYEKARLKGLYSADKAHIPNQN